MPRLSIIVPVYQAQLYIQNCIENILNQKFSDFELLLVDDGSTDKSGTICESYAAKDNRIRVFHKENAGVSSARNLGLDYAQGNYICFVDADDWIERDFLEKSMMAIKKADLLQHGALQEVWKDGKIVQQKRKYVFPYEGVFDRNALSQLIPTSFDFLGVSVYAYLFKRELIQNLRFDTTMSYSEDYCFVLQALSKANTFCFIKNNLGYHYNVRMGSAAFRWQPDMLRCYLKSFHSMDIMLESFSLSMHQIETMKATKIVEAYSSIIYNLCFSSCTLTFFEKCKFAKQARDILKYDLYKSKYQKNTNLFDSVKILLTDMHLEFLLILFGSFYVK